MVLLITALAIALVIAITLLQGKRTCSGWIQNTFYIDNTKITGKNMALTALPQQRIPFTLQPVDRKGNPAQVEAGTVEYWIDDTTIADVEEDPNNELAGWIVTTATGVTQLNYAADADLGEGVVSITGFDAIEVQAEQAVGFGVTFGPAEDI
jgi:hypothetical protein